MNFGSFVPGAPALNFSPVNFGKQGGLGGQGMGILKAALAQQRGGGGGVQGMNGLPTDQPNNADGIYTGPASQPGFAPQQPGMLAGLLAKLQGLQGGGMGGAQPTMMPNALSGLW